MGLLKIPTERREELRDITDQVREAVRDLSVTSGVCHLFSLHTTCGVTVNEGWDPDVATDVVGHLGELVPHEHRWRHAEGNSDAHLKTMLVGVSATVPVEAGDVVLGRWQRIFLCEFDGPRTREIHVSVLGG